MPIHHTSAASPTLTLIRNASVFTPEALGLRQLLVGGGKILWIGSLDDPAPAVLGLDVIDMAGKRLIPGLIDGHAHVTGGGGEGGFATREIGRAHV